MIEISDKKAMKKKISKSGVITREIGRASCRERVLMPVLMWGGGGEGDWIDVRLLS